MWVIHHRLVSPYSVAMGVLWFSLFICLSLLMRRLKIPVKFSVAPLLLVLVLSVFRMFVAIEMPGAVIALSYTVYPAVLNVLRDEFWPYSVLGVPVNLASVLMFIWGAGVLWLTVRYFYRYFSKLNSVVKMVEDYDRDEDAEELLDSLVGCGKKFRIYRSRGFETAVAVAFKPYIVLPELEFTADELRVILLHEWKHIRDRDYLTVIAVNLFCFIFWWNPLAYFFRENVCFANELKSDQFAVSGRQDCYHFLRGLMEMEKPEKPCADKTDGVVSSLAKASKDSKGSVELKERLNVLLMRGDSHRGKKIATNIFYSSVLVALFIFSYMFIVLPAFWYPSDISAPAEDFTEEYADSGGVFRADENYLIDNGGGIFSLYINGQFVRYIDEAYNYELIRILPIRERTSD